MQSKLVQIIPAPGWSVRLRSSDRGWNPQPDLNVERTIGLICWALAEHPETGRRRITALITEPFTGRLVMVDEWAARMGMTVEGWESTATAPAQEVPAA